jgi:hypothetical protein
LAAACPRIADEIGNVGAMTPFNHTNPTIYDEFSDSMQPSIERLTHEASVGPFPNVTCDSKKAVLVGRMSTDWLRSLIRFNPVTARFQRVFG